MVGNNMWKVTRWFRTPGVNYCEEDVLSMDTASEAVEWCLDDLNTDSLFKLYVEKVD